MCEIWEEIGDGLRFLRNAIDTLRIGCAEVRSASIELPSLTYAQAELRKKRAQPA